MGKTKTASEKLQFLGVSQLAFYVVFLLILGIGETVYINLAKAEGSLYGGIYPTMWVPFAWLGLLLVPSVIPFIRVVSAFNLRAIKVARVLQIILFAFVAFLTFPAYLLVQTVFTTVTLDTTVVFGFRPGAAILGCTYFVACVLGIIYFPFMLAITKKALQIESTNPNSDLIKQ